MGWWEESVCGPTSVPFMWGPWGGRCVSRAAAPSIVCFHIHPSRVQCQVLSRMLGSQQGEKGTLVHVMSLNEEELRPKSEGPCPLPGAERVPRCRLIVTSSFSCCSGVTCGPRLVMFLGTDSEQQPPNLTACWRRQACINSHFVPWALWPFSSA